MKKALIRSVLVVLAVAISIGVGFAYDKICTAIEKRTYPQKYQEFVEKYSRLYEVPEEIIYAVIKVESNFEIEAVSVKKATGLMQMMPETFEELTVLLGDNYPKETLYDPEVSIKYGTYYLSMLYKKYALWDNAIAAYNAGMGRVDAWLENEEYTENGHLKVIPIEETSVYVEKVNRAVEIYRKLYTFENEEF